MKTQGSVDSFVVVFDNGKPSLLCQVRKIMESGAGSPVLYLFVVNGAWYLTLDTVTGVGIIHHRWGDPQRRKGELCAVPLTAVPGVPSGDYNAILSYIEDSGYVPSHPSNFGVRLRLLAGVAGAFWRRLGPALRAFWGVLSGREQAQVIDRSFEEDEYDEIPF